MNGPRDFKNRQFDNSRFALSRFKIWQQGLNFISFVLASLVCVSAAMAADDNALSSKKVQAEDRQQTDVAAKIDMLETAVLNATEGSEDSLSGARVSKVTRDGDFITVEVSMDGDRMSAVEEIRVVGVRPEPQFTFSKAPEPLRGEDGRPYGVAFQIKSLPGFEFRLQLYNALEDENKKH